MRFGSVRSEARRASRATSRIMSRRCYNAAVKQALFRGVGRSRLPGCWPGTA